MSKANVLSTPQPWKPADATDGIRQIAKGNFRFHLTAHAKEQMALRDLTSGDVLHVLKHGFVYEPAEEATQARCFKYRIECVTPAGPRTVRVVAIPWPHPPEIKIVTVMWRDEKGF